MRYECGGMMFMKREHLHKSLKLLTLSITDNMQLALGFELRIEIMISRLYTELNCRNVS